jgi:hypothetical protein
MSFLRSAAKASPKLGDEATRSRPKGDAVRTLTLPSGERISVVREDVMAKAIKAASKAS